MPSQRGLRPLRGLVGAASLGVAVTLAGCTAGSPTPSESAPPIPTPSPTASSAPAVPSSPSASARAPQQIRLPLKEGASVRVAGLDANGAPSPNTPALVSFREAACEDQFDDYGLDTDGRVTDVEAPKNKQLCLVALSVRNAGSKPVSWAVDPTAILVGSDGKQYPVSSKRWSPGQIASVEGEKYAGDGDLIPPGETEYDYAMFAVPESVEPVTLRYVEPG